MAVRNVELLSRCCRNCYLGVVLTLIFEYGLLCGCLYRVVTDRQ